MQRCIDALKVFFATPIGNKWLHTIDVYPAFLIKSSVDKSKATQLCAEISQKIKEGATNFEFAAQ